MKGRDEHIPFVDSAQINTHLGAAIFCRTTFVIFTYHEKQSEVKVFWEVTEAWRHPNESLKRVREMIMTCFSLYLFCTHKRRSPMTLKKKVSALGGHLDNIPMQLFSMRVNTHSSRVP